MRAARAVCPVCENACSIPPGGAGRCGRYGNYDGVISERYPNRYLLVCPIRIETMPMLHFYPGARFLQVSTVGCNFTCPGCISTTIVQEMDPDSPALKVLGPEDVVARALDSDCRGISFLMNDPQAAFDSFLAVAREAKKNGLLVGCATNGYFSRAALDRLLPLLDFVNVGVKGLSAEVYRACGGMKGAAPVLRNIRLLHAGGVHVEVACIHRKDNAEELMKLCALIREISPRIPLQVMRFIPLANADPHQEPLIRETEALCARMRTQLPYVYVFNSPGSEALNTICPQCGKSVLQRDFYGPMGAKLKNRTWAEDETVNCPHCHHDLAVVGEISTRDFTEENFQGGYPFTRALEIVESVLIAIGAERKAEVVHVWEYLLGRNKLNDLHLNIQRTDKYLEMVRNFGRLLHREAQADALADYLEQRTAMVQSVCAQQPGHPRVYYAMGKPLFCIKGGRFENHLITLCGGVSVNREVAAYGRPGMNISAETLTALNPDIVLISSFLTNAPGDFLQACATLHVAINAVRDRRVYTPPIPCSDFGSPKWILGLMYIANVLYPDGCRFDIAKEAKDFYARFYHRPFDMREVNRSFGKPDALWHWKTERSASHMMHS